MQFLDLPNLSSRPKIFWVKKLIKIGILINWGITQYFHETRQVTYWNNWVNRLPKIYTTPNITLIFFISSSLVINHSSFLWAICLLCRRRQPRAQPITPYTSHRPTHHYQTTTLPLSTNQTRPHCTYQPVNHHHRTTSIHHSKPLAYSFEQPNLICIYCFFTWHNKEKQAIQSISMLLIKRVKRIVAIRDLHLNQNESLCEKDQKFGIILPNSRWMMDP